jgi:hypothetical protein
MVLQVYTSLDLVGKFILDNNISTYDILTGVGEVYIYDTEYIYDELIYNEIMDNKYKFCSFGNILFPLYENNDIFLTTEDVTIIDTENSESFKI